MAEADRTPEKAQELQQAAMEAVTAEDRRTALRTRRAEVTSMRSDLAARKQELAGHAADMAGNERVDVNSAAVEVLAAVPGVGKETAKAISEKRTLRPIHSASELVDLGVKEAAFDRLFVPAQVTVLAYDQTDLPPVAFQKAALKVQTAVESGEMRYSEANVGLAWDSTTGRYTIRQRGEGASETLATEVQEAFTAAARPAIGQKASRTPNVLFIPFINGLGMLSETIKDKFVVEVDDLVTRLESPEQRKAVLEFAAQHELYHIVNPQATEAEVIANDMQYFSGRMTAEGRDLLMNVLNPANENLIDISPVSYFGLFTLVSRGESAKAQAYAEVLAEHVHERTTAEEALAGAAHYGARALIAEILLDVSAVEGEQVDFSSFAWRTASVAQRLSKLTPAESWEAAKLLDAVKDAVPGRQQLKALLLSVQPTYAEIGAYVQSTDPAYAEFADMVAEMERFMGDPVSADESEADPEKETSPAEPALIGTST